MAWIKGMNGDLGLEGLDSGLRRNDGGLGNDRRNWGMTGAIGPRGLIGNAA